MIYCYFKEWYGINLCIGELIDQCRVLRLNYYCSCLGEQKAL